jgi:transaldolase
MPDATVADFLDHGRVARTVDADYAGSDQVIADLASAGIHMEDVAQVLESEGVASFAASFDELMQSLTEKAGQLAGRS